MKKYLVKESKRLTRQAKAIFGDIVDTAYFAEYDSDYGNEQLYNTSDQKNTSKDLTRINIGCLIVVIKFNNGKIVSFNSSEWGDIEAVESVKSYSPELVK